MPSSERLTNKWCCESVASSADFVLTMPPDPYAKALKMTRCESIEPTFPKRQLFFAGGWRGKARSDYPVG